MDTYRYQISTWSRWSIAWNIVLAGLLLWGAIYAPDKEAAAELAFSSGALLVMAVAKWKENRVAAALERIAP